MRIERQPTQQDNHKAQPFVVAGRDCAAQLRHDEELLYVICGCPVLVCDERYFSERNGWLLFALGNVVAVHDDQYFSV